jgi:hypothetical protein
MEQARETTENKDQIQEKSPSEGIIEKVNNESAGNPDERSSPAGNDEQCSTNDVSTEHSTYHPLAIPKDCANTRKNYNSLSLSTKLPARDHPSLEQTREASKAAISPLVKHEYQNQEENESSHGSQALDNVQRSN